MARERTITSLIEHYDAWAGKTPESSENWYGREASMTSDLHPYTELFSPIKINKLTIKNRIVMAPMGNINMAEENGRPAPMMLEYFFERARGGAGLITTGLVPVSHGLDASVTELGKLSYFPRIDRSRTVLAGWRDLAKGIHAHGSRVFIQLTSGLGRVGNPECLVHQKKFPQSSSLNPNFYIPSIPSLPMSDVKLGKIIKNTGQAAATAKAMEIDGVYLHGHEGYLLDQMTNPAFNRRKLGKYTDWQRFGVDTVKEIRRRVGPDYPIMYRIDLSLALEETYSDKVLDSTYLGKFRGGRTVADTLGYMESLVRAGVDIFDVDLGCYDNWWLPHPPASMPAGCFLDVSQIAKEYFERHNILSNAGVPVPIVAVGKLGYPDLAERALRENMCDMVMLGRPLLADPQWPAKAQAGAVKDIIPCIGCQEGCVNEFVEGGHPQCAVNPRTSFEFKFPLHPPRTDNPKKIAVVGAGPAGLTFAHTAFVRGHEVHLFEASNRIGGRINAGSVPRTKFDVGNYLRFLQQRLDDDVAKGLVFTKNTAVNRSDLKDYDAVVVAVGTNNALPPIAGIDTVKCAQAVDLFENPTLLEGVHTVTIIGGGSVGCELAHWLAYEHRRDVKVVEMRNHFMAGTCTANRGHLIHALEAAGVELINAAKVERIAGNSVHIARNVHKNVPNPYNTWTPILPENIENPLAPKVGIEIEQRTISADLVVFAAGGYANDSLYFELVRAGEHAEIHNIGDSFKGGRIWEAVSAGYRLGLTV